MQEAAAQEATTIMKKKFTSWSIRMLYLSLNELKLIARSKHIKDYKSMSKERLVSVLNKSKSVEGEKNLDNARIKKIREDFNELRDRLLKPKVKEIRKNLYEMENKKNLSK